MRQYTFLSDKDVALPLYGEGREERGRAIEEDHKDKVNRGRLFLRQLRRPPHQTVCYGQDNRKCHHEGLLPMGWP